MTKSKFMRVAAVLMAAVLLTTCAISGTFAKYVTRDSASDTARVAAWGVEVDAAGTLFNSTYATNGTVKDYNNADIPNSVVGTSSAKVVAPGTSGSLAAFTVTGTPEVAVNVAFSGTLALTGWQIDDDNDNSTPAVDYCPLVITVNTTPYSIDGSTITDVDDLVDAVNDAIAASSKNYAPGTNLGTTGTGAVSAAAGLAVSWAWDFDDSGAGTNDAKDTKLANLASAPQISLTTSVAVTQID